MGKNTTHVEGKSTSQPVRAQEPPANPQDEQLSRARTAYNYMRSYPNLEAVPLCASVPAAEQLTADYNALVLRSSTQIADNFLENATRLLLERLQADLSAYAFAKVLADIEDAVIGLKNVIAESATEGPTAFLKSTLWDMLRPGGRDILDAKCEADFELLLGSLPKPLMLTLPKATWMPDPTPTAQHQCEQDWFFGYLQVAGFNTTNLCAVVLDEKPPRKAMSLSELKGKLGIDNKILQGVLGDATMTLERAAAEGALYVCDYTLLIGNGDLKDKQSSVHDKLRYLPSPVALFYWNEKPPLGYPKGYRGDGSKGDGVLQPVAIQLTPGSGAAVFTPNDFTKVDSSGWKWKLAKYFVNVACGIQHESIAHLGNCHFVMESIVVATHRQLPTDHPLFQLLEPHMRFTLSINDGALRTLVAPGGVVATNIGANIHWTLTLVNEARKAWRWDENSPERLFAERGVDVDRPLVFPFRDDTLLLWKATKNFVRAYVEDVYPDNQPVGDDARLKAWIHELKSPSGGGFHGLEMPTTHEQLVQILAQIIYTAGPLHASLNYAQYPLGAYTPSVAATIYQPAPTSETKLASESDYVKWLPPLDIALYTLSFEYLLSTIQYDVFGQYASNPQFPVFDEPARQAALEDFQHELADAEAKINGRNRKRPMPYTFQLPSRIPNSISL